MRTISSFTRECLCCFLATLLMALPVLALPKKSVNTSPSTISFSIKGLLRTWIPSLFLSPYAKGSALQTGTAPNLDTLRSNLPQAPAAYTQGSLPPASYVDPTPLSDTLVDAYLTQMTLEHNQGGPVGALPLQPADPTTGGSVLSGFSVNMQHKQYNFTTPLLNLAGRAGLNVALGASYSSRVMVDTNGVRAFNTERGFPAPGWRLGFGSIEFVYPRNWGYVSSVSNEWTFLYLSPSGSRHELKYNSANGWWESYDGT